MIEPLAIFGDLHGCIEEFVELHELLVWQGVRNFRIAGDYVDRGPDSEAVIQYCIRHGIKGVMGNHDSVIVNYYDAWKKAGHFPTRNQDKQRTLSQLSESSYKYLKGLPYLEVFDDRKLVLVHGGLIPGLGLCQQTRKESMICRLQLVHPDYPNDTRWFNLDRKGRTEVENREEGWTRWYEQHYWEYDVVFGHSVFKEPLVYQNEGCGRCIGIDTGSCFGMSLTAVVLPELRFVSVKAKADYCKLNRIVGD